MVRSETTLFLWQDPHALAVFAEAASDDLQQYLAGVRYQRDAPVVAARWRILLFMKRHHDDDIFLLLRHLAPPPNRNHDIEPSLTQGRDEELVRPGADGVARSGFSTWKYA